jgi:hypothetical protein
LAEVYHPNVTNMGSMDMYLVGWLDQNLTPQTQTRALCPPERSNANPVTAPKIPITNKIRRTIVAFLTFIP